MTLRRMTALVSVLASWRAEAQDSPSPNAPIAKPQCDVAKSVSFRYTEGSERLYVEHEDGTTRGGCVTLTEIWGNQDGGTVLFAVDPDSGDASDTATGTWLLAENLSIEDGITLQVSWYSSFIHNPNLNLDRTGSTLPVRSYINTCAT